MEDCIIVFAASTCTASQCGWQPLYRRSSLFSCVEFHLWIAVKHGFAQVFNSKLYTRLRVSMGLCVCVFAWRSTWCIGVSMFLCRGVCVYTDVYAYLCVSVPFCAYRLVSTRVCASLLVSANACRCMCLFVFVCVCQSVPMRVHACPYVSISYALLSV